MKAILVSLLLTLVGNLFSKENIKELLAFIFKYLEEQAALTSNTLDDDALNVVEIILKQDELADRISELVKKKIKE